MISGELVPLISLSPPTPSSAEVAVEPPFFLPAPSKVKRDGPFLGWVRGAGQNLYPAFLARDDFVTHVAIFGMTGSGKSTTAGALVARLMGLGAKVLIIDWHSEYRGLMLARNELVFTPGKSIAPLTINPLDPSLSDDLGEHISLVTDIFSEAFQFSPPQSFMFREALASAYEKCGYPSKSIAQPPTISTVLYEIEHRAVTSKYDNEIKMALGRRLVPLTVGQAGRALDGQSTISIKELLENSVSIELGHFKEQEVRKVFSYILFKLLYDFRMGKHSSSLVHVTVMEEAKNIVPARARGEPPSVGERIISELRKFGEASVVVAQFPTQVSDEMLKNSATRICHQLKTEDDRRILQGALGLNEWQAGFLHYLRPGEAVVSLPGVDHPFHVYVDPESYPNPGDISDERLASFMRERFYKGRQSLQLLKPVSTDLEIFQFYPRLHDLFERRREIRLNQLNELLKLPPLEFYALIYPLVLDMVEEGVLEEILGSKPAEDLYRFRGWTYRANLSLGS